MRIDASSEAEYHGIQTRSGLLSHIHETIRKWIYKGKHWKNDNIKNRESERDRFRTRPYTSSFDQTLQVADAGGDGFEEDPFFDCEDQSPEIDGFHELDVFGHGFGFDDND